MDRSVQPTARAEAAAPEIHLGTGKRPMPVAQHPAPDLNGAALEGAAGQAKIYNVTTLDRDQSAPLVESLAAFEPFMPADQQVREFASICGIPDLGDCRQLLDYYILHRYQGRYPPALIDHALRHALLAARQTVIRVNPFGWIDTAVSNRIAQYTRHELQLELDVRTMTLRAQAEARGEVFLPPPATLQREIAKWLADPGKWSGIKPGLNYDHIAEVAEEFVDLPLAKPITPRDVRKAFEDAPTTRYSSHTLQLLPLSIAQIQQSARAAIYHSACGLPTDQLQGRPAINLNSWHSTDYAMLPVELLDDVIAAHPDVFDDRPLVDDRGKRRDHLISDLGAFVSTVGKPGNADYPASLYGNGLQERVEARAHELAHQWCDAKRAEDVEAIAEHCRSHQRALVALEEKRGRDLEHEYERRHLVNLERRIAEWPELHARLLGKGAATC